MRSSRSSYALIAALFTITFITPSCEEGSDDPVEASADASQGEGETRTSSGETSGGEGDVSVEDDASEGDVSVEDDASEGSEDVDELGPCSDEECGPAPGAPNYTCDDGVTIAGPGPCERQDNGECGWTMVECPQTPSCDPEECKPVPDACVDNWVYPGWHQECDDAIGECISYTAEQPVDCTNSGLICVDGACVAPTDLCADVVCENTPPYCDGDFAAGNVLYSCNPDTGECEISSSEAPEDCTSLGLICVDGLCVEEDLCADVLCESTEASCDGDVALGAVVQECDPTSGECITAPGLPPTDCAEIGMICVDGACQDAPACEEEDCGPMPGMPNYTCDDGVTIAGPGACEVQDNGACGWTIVECPEPGQCTPGESIEAGDGCNTCMCAASGLVSESLNCTKKACVCQTSKECHEGFYCDFPNDDCGIWGSSGNCEAIPETCIAGGPGACGCGPVSTTNGCEQQAMGFDVFTYGGCTLGAEETFACGEITCQSSSELCTISMNDVMGPDQPLFYNSCSPLPDDCGQGDCGCIAVDEWMSCYDETGHTMVFYPGG